MEESKKVSVTNSVLLHLKFGLLSWNTKLNKLETLKVFRVRAKNVWNTFFLLLHVQIWLSQPQNQSHDFFFLIQSLFS